MTMEDILALPVAELAAPDAVLLLWAINSMLPQGLKVMEAWGFTYKTVAFTWAKTTPSSEASWAPVYHMGLGYWTRQNTEQCLLGTRGKPKRTGKDVRQLIVSPRRQHSRKPAEFFQSVERLVPGPFLDLFARERRPNWDVWGNEVGVFDGAAA
jgi:N6-adenosine-specific RNA methylase IME4